MSVEGLGLSAVLISLTALLVALPLLRRSHNFTLDQARRLKQRERLLAYYERVLTNLRDLDEDHATGKMLDADYTPEREQWVQRGIEVLKALDSAKDHSIIPAAAVDDAAVDEAVDDAIEATIRKYRSMAAQTAAQGANGPAKAKPKAH